tara:strand:- start:582 stop:2150 length:1569 start_codon:yes stop_codon:yes gene_type:complete
LSKVLFNDEAKEKILAGVNLVADAVKPTLGPQAKTVVLQTYPKPTVINDGVTIAKFVSSDDPFIQMGIELIQNVASEAQSNTGDGTTTACVLAQALCDYFNQETIENLAEFRKSILEYTDAICAVLDTMAEPVDNQEKIEQIATIASNNDEELGGLISEVISLAGEECVISVQEGTTNETSIEIVNGYEIDRGMVSHTMINQDDGSCVLDNPYILMTNEDIKNFQDILPYLEHCNTHKRPLLIMARDVTGSALANIIVNILRKTIDCCIIKAPSFGDAMIDEMNDISSIVGGKVIDVDSGEDISKNDDLVLGMASKAIINKDRTIITVDGNDETDKRVSDRAIALEIKFNSTDDKYLASRLKKRIAKLRGGIARITVGAPTEIELKEKKERLDDALNATQAAREQGYVVGGGKALIDASTQMEENDFNVLMCKIFHEPYFQIAKNAGVDLTYSDVSNMYGVGFDALKIENDVNLLERGIIDPVKVTKSSFRSAVSIALMVLTTEVAIIGGENEMALPAHLGQ